MKTLFMTSSVVIILSIAFSPAYGEEMTTEDQKLAFIGEWRCDWPGVSGDSSTLIIHEIDSKNGKARCTFIIQPGDAAKSEYEVLADFFHGSNPKLSFKAGGNDFTCVLYKDILSSRP